MPYHPYRCWSLSLALPLAIPLAIASAVLLPQMATANRTVDRAVIDSYNFRHQRQPQKALAALKLVEGQATSNAGFYAERAANLVEIDKYDDALNDCNQAIKLDPNLSDAYDRRAFCYAMKDQLDKAVADYTTAIKLNPTSAMSYHNRAIAYRKMGKLKEANLDMKKYMSMRPAREKNRLGNMVSIKAEEMQKEGNTRGAIEYLKSQIAASPSAALYLHLGGIYQKTGDYANAIKNFDTVIKLAKDEPDHALIRSAELARAMTYFKQKNYSAAIKDCTAVIDESKRTETVSARRTISKGDGTVAMIIRSDCYRLTGKQDLAMKDISAVIAANPDLNIAYATRGAILAAGGDHARAIPDFDRSIKASPNSDAVRMERASSFKALKKYDLALKDYSTIINKSPSAAREAYKGRADVYQLMKDKKRADADLAKAQEAQPD
jgi:tetratricopeptide (TPR) repeat protein